MAEGTSSGNQSAINEEYVDPSLTVSYELLRTWREKIDEANFLRLNKEKCDVLLSYLEQAREKHHSKSCEPAAREYLLAVKRAKFLLDESAHSKWLLKALELWECSQHFIEVCMDLASTVEELEETVKEYCERLLSAQCDDKVTLGTMVEITIQENIGDTERQLAVLLQDRCNVRSMRHPQFLKNFKFSIRTRFNFFGKTKSGQNGVVIIFPWVYNKDFAVKMRQPKSDEVGVVFKHEFNILDKYRSPYIVGVVGYWELNMRPFLLMEAMECDLEGLITSYRKLRKGKPEGFSTLETIKLMLPVAKALRFLHGKDVAHRDIKPQNIMCSNTSGDFDEAIVKLIDFGVARSTASTLLNAEIGIAGTSGYRDPAMRTPGFEKCDLFRADVFSFALVFVELLTWRYPWEDTGIQRGLPVQKKLNDGERPPLPDDLPYYVSFIVECCWCQDLPVRPTFEDICKMLHYAKLLLLDENYSDDLDELFCYEDGQGLSRSIGDPPFLPS